jgi:glycosyltransferase involved in cell wall biosynthesis
VGRIGGQGHQEMKHADIVFTVFTPTYNRQHTLNRVYESLRMQTFKAFEWVIVDDGSIDNTKELVSQWQEESWFPIRYFYQSNQGKHIAYNRGVAEARGELFQPLDSDDSCFPDALMKLYQHWMAIPPAQRQHFFAVTGLCVDQYGKLVGNKFPKDVFDSDSLEILYKFKVKGDKWGFQRTDLLRKFPFPDLLGEKFIPEGVVWHAIAREYKTRFINQPLLTCWLGSIDQLTYKGNPARFARGLAYGHLGVLNKELDYFKYAPWFFIKTAVHFSRFSFHAGENLGQQANLVNQHAFWLWLVTVPVGLGVYLYDKRKYSTRRGTR